MTANLPHDDVYLGGVSVLVVDDRATVAAMLEHCGAAVTVVGSADEALEALERERPDVLVSNVAMPDKGGYWLIGKVRALPPERGGATPAAALTAFTCPEHRASILRAGFQYYIEKPVTLEKLAGIVALLALKAQSLLVVGEGTRSVIAGRAFDLYRRHVSRDNLPVLGDDVVLREVTAERGAQVRAPRAAARRDQGNLEG
jgi:CheY-like chemotaxis protein